MGREKVLAIIAFSLLTTSACAGAGIEVQKQMDELKAIANDGNDVFRSMLSIIEGVTLVEDVASAKALMQLYALEDYEEPADPESHVKEYFSVYKGELPEVEGDVLRAWQDISLAKEEKVLAERECKTLKGFPACIKLTERMVKHVIGGNKEAASAGQALFELTEQDLKSLEHAGANRFYYSGPAYQTYYDAAKELKEREKLAKFFEAMLFYTSMNEELLKGKAKVAWAMPEEGALLEKILGIHLEAMISHPISYHEPYNKLVRYYGPSGIKEMLAFKQELVDARKSMDTYYGEWEAKLDSRVEGCSETREKLDKEGILLLSTEEIELFSETDLLGQYWWARTELAAARGQKENATWLRQDEHRGEFLALATREMQDAHSKAARAETSFGEVLGELEAMRLEARDECWNSTLDKDNWVAELINSKIRASCEEGDSAETLGEAIKAYARGVKSYQTANSNDPIGDTREALDELGLLLEKAGRDLNVSTEKHFYNELLERFKDAQELDAENALFELVGINEKAESLKQELLRKARIDYGDLPGLQLDMQGIADKYPLVVLERDLGELAKIREYYTERLESLPQARAKMRYEFLETSGCNGWIPTEFVIRLDNTYSTKTQNTMIQLESIPAELELNNASAYYENGSIQLEAPSVQPRNFTELRLQGKSKPLECTDVKEQLEETIGNYSIYSKTKRIVAATSLPSAVIEFGKDLIETDAGNVNGTRIELSYVEEGEHFVTAKFLTRNSSVTYDVINATNETKPVAPEQESTGGTGPENAIMKTPGLNRSEADRLVKELAEACDTQIELNATVPVEFDERDLEDYRIRLGQTASQGEIDALTLELRSAWSKLMSNAKNEIEETQAVMKEKEDYAQLEWLDRAKLEYNAKHFNKAFIYAYYARSRTMLGNKEEPTALVPMNALPAAGFFIVTASLVFYFRRNGKKKTRIESALEAIKTRESYPRK